MAIVQPSINELVEKVDCRYTLVVEASKRARELVDGQQPLISAAEDLKPLKIAVEEINHGLISFSREGMDN